MRYWVVQRVIEGDTEHFDLKVITTDKKEALRYHYQRTSHEDGGREFFYEEDDDEHLYLYMVCDKKGSVYDSFFSNSYPPKGYHTDIGHKYKGNLDVSLKKGSKYLYVIVEG